MRIGAHVSIAGGMDKAVERGQILECQAIQVFTKNNNQWRAAPLTEEGVKLFRSRLKASLIAPVVAHASYLLNLASCDETMIPKCRQGLEVELERCDQLRIPFLVVHPGSHMGAGEEAGIRQVAATIDDIYERRKFRTVVCLEHTAGQGNHIGYRFEQLAAIREASRHKRKIGFCLDTCHLAAAGYDLTTERRYRAVLDEFDQVVGLRHCKCFHLNDSKTQIGSRVDRHEHIGKGTLGLGPFRYLLNDARFANHPGLIETPTNPEMSFERKNLRVLRGLIE